MTKRTPKHLQIVLLVVVLVVGACSRTDGHDYCRNHYRFHADHSDEIGRLTIDLTTEGVLTRTLDLPEAIVDGDLPDSLFGLQTESACISTGVSVASENGRQVAVFESRCGAGNRLRQLDVSVFDFLPELDEIDVTMTTPATQKRFAISRQCDAPIFRLD